MALKIRLRKQGRMNRHFYRVVVTDSRSPRDGKYIEAVGWYNPHEDKPENNLFLDEAKLQKWIGDGVEISESVQCLMAKGAPEATRILRDKKQAARLKATAKRRELRRRKAAARV